VDQPTSGFFIACDISMNDEFIFPDLTHGIVALRIVE
jgi:hypothetical protein